MNLTLKNRLFWIGAVVFILPALVQAYLLMPFPGSQDLEAIKITYFLEKIILPSRIIGLLLLIVPVWSFLTNGTIKQKVWLGVVALISIGLFYFTDVAYRAQEMFKEPVKIQFAGKKDNQVPDSLLVMTVVNGSVAKAYPIQYVGYHHKIQDNVAGKPVLVTYCTMCRTGLVFSPVVDGKLQTFRLVGARHYNAVIEDSDTRSWWYQATGEAVAGKQTGKHLDIIPSEQITLKAFFERYPEGLVFQPDNTFKEGYEVLKTYDRREKKDEDSLTNPGKVWDKSWVVGISADGKNKAYIWKNLVNVTTLNDKVGNTPLVIAIEADNYSFHVFTRTVEGKILNFVPDAAGIRDKETHSLWNWQGECTEGEWKGKKLTKIYARQEYLRAWKQFHQPTEIWP
ncbi:DUF3179 domain-containing (seleno)protein [Emticicia sp. 21SJ11W-3]|uniref:DUF3179 domain-containing (seleno)protein n=1 Tax=Emticicia sp. 21SJ11W-3 TaxID=2916755 RepID=UPI00209FE90C|nr:DUF3179 domain-containing (seleno)protein [Emticicia sp. 21SJ11W-3]UTA69304.1 DUF3179 domain-containing protein [Emticicia sp. 21SJ11W-3]